MRGSDRIVIRTYHTLSGDQYLLLFYPFYDDTSYRGYGLSMINGKEIVALQITPSVNYAIYDSNQYILSTNDYQFIQTTRGKLNNASFNNNNLLNHYDIVNQSIGEDLFIMTYQSFDNYYVVLIRSLIAFIIVTIIVVLQSYYFSTRVSKKIGYSLQQLTQEMKKVESDTNYLIDISTKDEFETLANQINQMLGQLKEKNVENKLLNELNLEIEKRKLDAQFNPHFFANTLETIRSIMYIEPNVASKLILMMTRILRYSI